MSESRVEELLRQANSDLEGDTSLNSAKRNCASEEGAESLFADVKRRMLDIREWHENSSGSGYDLFDETGRDASDTPVDVGKFIRISIYGAGKYDWVRVTDIHNAENEFVITVKPTFDPTEHPRKTDVISHFFRPEATNNFCLQRSDPYLNFYVIGLNEKQNTEFTDGLIETARNVAAANLGYYLGLQKAIWKEFCQNFLKTPEERDG